VDYLRLIWIVDYSGPRGAAWPRVSISEPLARAHLRLPLLLCLRSSRTLDPRYQTSLGRPPANSTHPFPPASPPPPPCPSSSPHPRNPRFLTGSSPPPRGSFSRSSSVPTRRLGLRPITCLPVIRCCANPSPFTSLRLASQFPLCSRRRKTWRISGREFAIITSRTNRDYYFVVRNPLVDGSPGAHPSRYFAPRITRSQDGDYFG